MEECEGAEGEAKSVLFFRNRNGLGVPPKRYENVLPAEKAAGKASLVGLVDDSE